MTFFAQEMAGLYKFTETVFEAWPIGHAECRDGAVPEKGTTVGPVIWVQQLVRSPRPYSQQSLRV